jgi:hypothetical protein
MDCISVTAQWSCPRCGLQQPHPTLHPTASENLCVGCRTVAPTGLDAIAIALINKAIGHAVLGSRHGVASRSELDSGTRLDLEWQSTGAPATTGIASTHAGWVSVWPAQRWVPEPIYIATSPRCDGCGAPVPLTPGVSVSTCTHCGQNKHIDPRLWKEALVSIQAKPAFIQFNPTSVWSRLQADEDIPWVTLLKHLPSENVVSWIHVGLSRSPTVAKDDALDLPEERLLSWIEMATAEVKTPEPFWRRQWVDLWLSLPFTPTDALARLCPVLVEPSLLARLAEHPCASISLWGRIHAQLSMILEDDSPSARAEKDELIRRIRSAHAYASAMSAARDPRTESEQLWDLGNTYWDGARDAVLNRNFPLDRLTPKTPGAVWALERPDCPDTLVASLAAGPPFAAATTKARQHPRWRPAFWEAPWRWLQMHLGL